ncbi:helix-turn-helix domain-containing protein [Croceicoccus pelagius]
MDRLDGNISQAARAIGMTRAQVQYSKKKNG